MGFLIDTCALSELTKPKPSRLVLDWFDAAKPETLFISVLTLGEIREGIEKMDGGRRRVRNRWMAGNRVAGLVRRPRSFD